MRRTPKPAKCKRLRSWANNGRYGPYLTKTGADGKSDTRSLASEDEIFTVDWIRPKNRSRSRSTDAVVDVARSAGRRCATWAPIRKPEAGDHQGTALRRVHHRRRDEPSLPKQYAPGIDRTGRPPARRQGRRVSPMQAAAKGNPRNHGEGERGLNRAADRRAKGEPADKGWANTRIAKEITHRVHREG